MYMHKPESTHENEENKIIWDFETQMDHPNRAKKPDLSLINKKEKEHVI